MSRTLRALAHLLRYPDDAMRHDLPALAEAWRAEAALPPDRQAELQALVTRLSRLEPLRAEADYVALFDRGRRTTLNLFEHVHGDSRDRGPAMVDLVRTYEHAGLLLRTDELPDNLTVVLEFASTLRPGEARAFLGELSHLLRALLGALQQQSSAYSAVPAALLALAGEAVSPVILPDEEDLDESWAEPPAFGGCSSAGQARPDAPQPIRIVKTPPRHPPGARP